MGTHPRILVGVLVGTMRRSGSTLKAGCRAVNFAEAIPASWSQGVHFIIRQQDRHPVMDIDDSVIGGSCQNYKPFLPLKSVPKPGQIQPVLPRQPKMVFPFF